jgi:hypothetical protein
MSYRALPADYIVLKRHLPQSIAILQEEHQKLLFEKKKDLARRGGSTNAGAGAEHDELAGAGSKLQFIASMVCHAPI